MDVSVQLSFFSNIQENPWMCGFLILLSWPSLWRKNMADDIEKRFFFVKIGNECHQCRSAFIF